MKDSLKEKKLDHFSKNIITWIIKNTPLQVNHPQTKADLNKSTKVLLTKWTLNENCASIIYDIIALMIYINYINDASMFKQILTVVAGQGGACFNSYTVE